jgi:hypothetical protein
MKNTPNNINHVQNKGTNNSVTLQFKYGANSSGALLFEYILAWREGRRNPWHPLVQLATGHVRHTPVKF